MLSKCQPTIIDSRVFQEIGLEAISSFSQKMDVRLAKKNPKTETYLIFLLKKKTFKLKRDLRETQKVVQVS